MRDWRVAMLIVVVITVLMRLDATAKAGCDTSLPTLYQQVSPICCLYFCRLDRLYASRRTYRHDRRLRGAHC